MVGGVVIGITRSERTHVNVADCPHYPKHGRGDECPRPDTCCVYVEERITNRNKREGPLGEKVEISIGDSIWWQSGLCYWIPKENYGRDDGRCGVDYDIPLPKLGYSH